MRSWWNGRHAERVNLGRVVPKHHSPSPKQKEIIMLEVFEILLPVGILMACAYGIGYMSGSQATKEIYDPKIRQSDLDKLRKL